MICKGENQGGHLKFHLLPPCLLSSFTVDQVTVHLWEDLKKFQHACLDILIDIWAEVRGYRHVIQAIMKDVVSWDTWLTAGIFQVEPVDVIAK